MPRLPLASVEDLQHELDLIAWDRERLSARIVGQEQRDNYLASLNEWEDDIRQQLAEAVQADKGTEA